MFYKPREVICFCWGNQFSIAAIEAFESQMPDILESDQVLGAGVRRNILQPVVTGQDKIAQNYMVCIVVKCMYNIYQNIGIYTNISSRPGRAGRPRCRLVFCMYLVYTCIYLYIF